jgi:hypothetical protein
MAQQAYPGPKGNLKAKQRRAGRSGTVWIDGRMMGDIVSIQWELTIEQIPVPMPGTWQDGTKPGAEARRGTFRFQDVDDEWRRMVWGFCQARRKGDRAGAAEFPSFDVISQIDDVGAPAKTRWSLLECQLYSYSGGFSQEDQLLVRDVPFTYEDDFPLDSFVYSDTGVTVYENG